MEQIIIQELKTILIANNKEYLNDFVSKLQHFDIAAMLSELEQEEQLMFISQVPIPLGAEILEYLEPELQYRLLDRIKDNFVSGLLNEMSSDMIVNLLLSIHPHQAKKLMDFLPDDYREKINTLMNCDPNTAGRLATVDYIAARKNWTVDQALHHIRKVGHEAEIIAYIYVLGSRGELVGVVSLKEIILAKSGMKLEEFVQGDPISVPVDMHQQEAAEVLSNYDLVAIPVLA